MKRFFLACVLMLTSGCASLGLGTNSALDPAVTNLILQLVGASSGLAIGGCVAPPIPDAYLTACLPVAAGATQQQTQDALTQCIASSITLIALTKYQQSICGKATTVTK